MTKIDIRNEYFSWLYSIVCSGAFPRETSHRDLLSCLHNIDFTFTVMRDRNRAEDGINLRYRFAVSNGYSDSIGFVLECLGGPCSVLEMMIALSIRCEETIMDDPEIGDRTGQWFWGMIINLGLGGMTDIHFDPDFVSETITRFLNRDYDPDGRGGLFTIRNCHRDLREVEIWYQLCWYLDSIT